MLEIFLFSIWKLLRLKAGLFASQNNRIKDHKLRKDLLKHPCSFTDTQRLAFTRWNHILGSLRNNDMSWWVSQTSDSHLCGEEHVIQRKGHGKKQWLGSHSVCRMDVFWDHPRRRGSAERQAIYSECYTFHISHHLFSFVATYAQADSLQTWFFNTLSLKLSCTHSLTAPFSIEMRNHDVSQRRQAWIAKITLHSDAWELETNIHITPSLL